MASTETTSSSAFDGLSLNMRSINNYLSKMFREYQMILGRILGGGLVGRSQVKYTYDDATGSYKEYDKGQIAFKDGIDRMQYLLNHRDEVSKIIGVDSYDIYQSRRDIGKTKEYLARLLGKCELGDSERPVQMYISRHDDNIGGLDSETDWVPYILQQQWIDELAQTTAYGISDGAQMPFSIEYLSDILSGMVKDHEIDYHRNLSEFQPYEYIDLGRKVETVEVDGEKTRTAEVLNESADAVNMLNSMGRLDYGFYEMYKPIGGGNGKYIKAKMWTDGTMDITGVVALSDMEHWEWKRGSKAFLRSLNNGNERYLLKLDIPFNDENSTLWWKPDFPEHLDPPENEESDEDEDAEPVVTRIFFKPYETERFLRWFGFDHIPALDVGTIEKATICSSPHLANDIQSEQFHSDARNLGESGMDLTRANIDNSTSLSLLSLATKSSIRVVDDPGDYKGQYLEFVVTGHRQTNIVSFHVRGKAVNEIQEMNHYIRTWERLKSLYEKVAGGVLYLDVCKVIIGSQVEDDWVKANPGMQLIPSQWTNILSTLGNLRTNATQIDLLRLRQIDLEEVEKWFVEQMKLRTDFINDNNRYSEDSYGQAAILSYINDYTNTKDSTLKLTKTQRETLLDDPLDRIYGKVNDRMTEDEIAQTKEREARYTASFANVTADELRERITTYNNLVVRLPVDSELNCKSSRRIFQDWWAFFDGARHHLVEGAHPELFVRTDSGEKWETTTGVGSDEKTYKFTELYIDSDCKTPLVDYSWLYDVTTDDGPERPFRDDTNKPIGDRWDYWTDDDFNWPQ